MLEGRTKHPASDDGRGVLHGCGSTAVCPWGVMGGTLFGFALAGASLAGAGMALCAAVVESVAMVADTQTNTQPLVSLVYARELVVNA